MGIRGGRVGGTVLVTLGFLGLLRSDFLLPISLGGEPSDAVSREDGCLSCHRKVLPGGHPVQVKPRRVAVPPGWPLDREGYMTCETCHRSCAGAPRGEVPKKRPPFLRSTSGGGDFCSECHPGGRPSGFTRVKMAMETNRILQATADPGERGLQPASNRRIPALTSAQKHARYISMAHPAASATTDHLDLTTRRCLWCHDGTVGPSRNVGVQGAPGIGTGKKTHPIGISYPLRPRPLRDNSYVARELLDPKILLPGGRLGCLSCHNLFTREAKLLVMSNRESRLCFACHEI